MDKFFMFCEALCYLAVFVGIAWYAIIKLRATWQAGAGQRQHVENKARLNKVGVIEPDEMIDPNEAYQRNREFLGVSSVSAGGTIRFTPNVNKEVVQVTDEEVLTTARIMAYTRQGAVPADITELTNGAMLVTVGKQKIILKKHDLTTRETDDLEKQRQDAVDRGDKLIEDYAGDPWNIIGAFGTNVTKKDGERECSYIQVLSVHKLIGQPGYETTLPTNILDGAEHDYYDLRARNTRTDEILFDFYTGGSWSCYIGRLLTDEEVILMKGI